MWQWQPQCPCWWPGQFQWHPLRQRTVAMPSVVNTFICALPQCTMVVVSSITNGTKPVLTLIHFTLNCVGISTQVNIDCLALSSLAFFCAGSATGRSGTDKTVSPSGLYSSGGVTGLVSRDKSTIWLSSSTVSRTLSLRSSGWVMAKHLSKSLGCHNLWAGLEQKMCFSSLPA